MLCVLCLQWKSAVFLLCGSTATEVCSLRQAVDADAMYDEIGGALRIKQYQEEKKELLESLELYYRVFFLGEEVPEEALMEEDGEKPNGK